MSVATAPEPTIVELYESATVTGKVDRRAGVISGVKVLGLISRNGREYAEAGVRKALPLYEGAPVSCNHPAAASANQPRDVHSRFGQIASVRFEHGAVHGDLLFLKCHSLAEAVCEAAERGLKTFGLSHVVEGKTVMRNGKTVVESIDRVRGVDLVSDPATTSGLFEARWNPGAPPIVPPPPTPMVNLAHAMAIIAEAAAVGINDAETIDLLLGLDGTARQVALRRFARSTPPAARPVAPKTMTEVRDMLRGHAPIREHVHSPLPAQAPSADEQHLAALWAHRQGHAGLALAIMSEGQDPGPRTTVDVTNVLSVREALRS